jgi:hypothetical protein
MTILTTINIALNRHNDDVYDHHNKSDNTHHRDDVYDRHKSDNTITTTSTAPTHHTTMATGTRELMMRLERYIF